MKTLTFRGLMCASGLLLAGGMYANSALAESPPIVRTVRVDTSGLDLTRPSDVRTLQQRIERAAREACSPLTLPDDPPDERGYQTCYRRAVQDATTQVQRLASNESAVRR
jgi:UrcA family protein